MKATLSQDKPTEIIAWAFDFAPASALVRLGECPSDTEGADFKKIALSNGMSILVDESDFEKLNKYKWHVHVRKSSCGNTYYAVSKIGGKSVSAHRMILNPPNGFVVDHVNGNGLDNRRSNLRFATHGQNIANSFKAIGRTSKFKGVHLNKESNKWFAQISVNGKTKNVGIFKHEISAALAYDVEAIKQYGKFAKVNFPNRLKARYANNF